MTIGAHVVLTSAHGAVGAATSVALGSSTALGLLVVATVRLRVREHRVARGEGHAA